MNESLGPDADCMLDCGCVIAINHGQYDFDLSSSDDCTEGHDLSADFDALCKKAL